MRIRRIDNNQTLTWKGHGSRKHSCESLFPKVAVLWRKHWSPELYKTDHSQPPLWTYLRGRTWLSKHFQGRHIWRVCVAISYATPYKMPLRCLLSGNKATIERFSVCVGDDRTTAVDVKEQNSYCLSLRSLCLMRWSITHVLINFLILLFSMLLINYYKQNGSLILHYDIKYS